MASFPPEYALDKYVTHESTRHPKSDLINSQNFYQRAVVLQATNASKEERIAFIKSYITTVADKFVMVIPDWNFTLRYIIQKTSNILLIEILHLLAGLGICRHPHAVQVGPLLPHKYMTHEMHRVIELVAAEFLRTRWSSIAEYHNNVYRMNPPH